MPLVSAPLSAEIGVLKGPVLAVETFSNAGGWFASA